MFKVVTNRETKRAWSARTVVISAAAHVLVLGGFAVAAESAGPVKPDTDESVTYFETKEPVKPVAPTPPPPAPVEQKQQDHVVLGDHREVPDVQKVPTTIPDPNPNEHFDASEYTRPGHQAGNVIVDNPPPAPPTPTTVPAEGPHDISTVEVRPELLNPREAQRILERAYPPLLRDSGVTGHTVVTLVIDREGKVEPGSVSVQETTNDAFRDAAVRAVERFRFRPAKLGGQAVPVIISLPIDWQIQS